ncbi:hypothetical protein Tsubulata_020375 [Turnera subulata]|uniref:F-box domain-containing protein n=1 Tax=Turnera subulata TaxID=218843 RepID=A0A9Q0FSI3_9ROSI|nr:hypothetical protein Tsubulata_020375 [Turnera subulata]
MSLTVSNAHIETQQIAAASNMQSRAHRHISPPPRRPPRIILSTAEIIGHNEDILTQILIHLPFNSLGKFRCVSKHWYSLITHHLPPRLYPPPCGLLYLRHQLQEDGSHQKQREYEYVAVDAANNRRAGIPFSSISLVDEPAETDIVRSTNGLLLFRNWGAGYGDYYVYSPITKQKRTLPPIENLVCYECLAYDPVVSVSNYKVVAIHRLRNYTPHQIVIYSSETGMWRVSNTLPPESLSVGYKRSVYLHGAVIWVGVDGHCCFRFDLDGEQLKKFDTPGGNFDYRYLCESRGRLYGVVKKLEKKQNDDDMIDGAWFDVYEMSTLCCAGWTLKHRIDVSSIITTCSDYDGLWFLSVVMEENQDDSLALVASRACGMIFRYNFKNKTFMEFHECDYLNQIEKALSYTEVLTFL